MGFRTVMVIASTWTIFVELQGFADRNTSAAVNFCRNPGHPERCYRERPWCYYGSGSRQWEYCYVPLCGEWDFYHCPLIKDIQCVQKKRGQNVFFVISSIKLGRFWWNLVDSFLNKFAAKCINVFHLTWMRSLHYLVKLEMFITQVLPLHCQRRKLQNLSHFNYGLQIRQIWIQLIIACWEYCKRRLQYVHHWSVWSETATENGVGQAGSCHHCSSHSSVASSIAAEQCCMFCTCRLTPLVQYFPHPVINWIQIWRIWRPQLRLDTFWSFPI